MKGVRHKLRSSVTERRLFDSGWDGKLSAETTADDQTIPSRSSKKKPRNPKTKSMRRNRLIARLKDADDEPKRPLKLKALPAELRLNVFEHYRSELRHPTQMESDVKEMSEENGSSDTQASLDKKTPCPPHLAQVCQQLWSEFVPEFEKFCKERLKDEEAEELLKENPKPQSSRTRMSAPSVSPSVAEVARSWLKKGCRWSGGKCMAGMLA